jgi:hypothetical protein
MSADYPVQVEVRSPVYFERVQLLVRIVLAVVLGWIGITAGWLACVLFGVLPLIAAVAVSSSGADRYAQDFGVRVWRALSWLLQLSAYMILLVDKFPAGDPDHPVRIELRVTARPTVGSALLRLLTSIPSGIVLIALWFVSGILWLVAALVVLVGGPMPASILAFQRGVLTWQARLVAYHASLVDEYPPFAFGDHVDRRATSSAA